VSRTRDALGADRYAGEYAAGKAMPLDELLQAARELQGIAEETPRDPREAEIERRTGLNGREVQALRLFIAGRSNQEIADEIGMTLAEAVALVGRIYAKLGVESRAEVTAFAFKNGLV
jgi:DNA-binding CsgD family transcriptional regulator